MSENLTKNMDGNVSTVSKSKQSKTALDKILNVVGIVLCVIIAPVLIVNMTLLVKSALDDSQPASFLGFTPLVVESGSMVPLLEVNDFLLIKDIDVSTLEEEDVVAYKTSDGIIVTHRIIEVTEDDKGNTVYMTQGDANNTPDDLEVYQGQILGVYVLNIHGLGGALNYLQTPAGLLFCILIPIIVIVGLGYLMSFIEKKKKS